MLEDVGPDLGKALVTGLLAGGASVAVQLLSPKVAKVLRRLRLNCAGKVANQQRVERRLAAILAADVAGYSRLMTADEEGTHFRLLTHRREVIEPKVREHQLLHLQSAANRVDHAADLPPCHRDSTEDAPGSLPPWAKAIGPRPTRHQPTGR